MLDQLEHFVLPGVLALVCVLLFTPYARRYALVRGITDKPAPGKAHRHPTPYLGGVAIAVGAVIAGLSVNGWSKGSFAIAAGAMLMACVGLLDDLRNLRVAPRLIAEVAAASAAAAAGARVDLLHNGGDWVLTVLWIVVISNSFNLLDNMDGAAGAIGGVTALGLAVAAAVEGQVLVGGLASVVAGACLGFLFYNRHPARIFMGDAGSLFLGYLLAVEALQLRFPVDRLDGLIAVLLLSGVALFDTTLVVLSRVLARRPISVGGTDHLSHRLRLTGLPVRFVAPVLALLTALSCGLAVTIGQGVLSHWAALPVPVLAALLLVPLLRLRVYEMGAGRVVPGRVRPAVQEEAVPVRRP